MKSPLRRKGVLLRLEGFILLTVSFGAYYQLFDNLLFILPVLVLPDLLMPKRFREHRLGSWIFDILHTYPAPALLITAAVIIDYQFNSTLAAIPLLWFMHIGFDRLLGRGARYDGAVVDDLYARAAILMASPEMAEHNLHRLGGSGGGWAEEDER
ncbi:MAG: hypothetical protein RL441_1029 [Actinomycetota bacterium]